MNVIISGTGGRGVSTFLDELLTQSAGNGTNWSSLDNATFIILLKVSANRYIFPNLSYFRWLVSLNSSFYHDCVCNKYDTPLFSTFYDPIFIFPDNLGAEISDVLLVETIPGMGRYICNCKVQN